MKSPVITVVIALLLAVVGYFLPFEGLSLSQGIALGIVLGGLLTPWLHSLIVKTAGDPEDTSETQTLYVGNLPYRANEEAVREHFAQCGSVVSVRLMKDRRTGKRKGYGFVEMAEAAADKAIKQLNDQSFQDRTLKVRVAKER
ncbi:Polyadenylate-binding protein [Saliniradius amylolyticus]|uniref:Polyadenylate-binding protein n=1 Tax=Saliniradius amylolyticus TaxID=2183582 RepID=A0A2S2E4B8_9ALTE|nr:RNA-binding protein [Saliniradius amylolyticus]AWL12484.1 Polyadenylate-binding protein [Saliniradius amylolyticus]